MPKEKRSKVKRQIEDTFKGEDLVHKPQKEKKSKELWTEESRSIKVVKVKGTYGTYIIKERLIPDDLRSIIYIVVLVGVLISVF
ncbi:hypothetical protein [Bacillus infantis]|uniref:hypothetical protein n=1 Tax=Bacillus infantis TaxID=324767 RepID=UPI003CF2FDAB